MTPLTHIEIAVPTEVKGLRHLLETDKLDGTGKQNVTLTFADKSQVILSSDAVLHSRCLNFVVGRVRLRQSVSKEELQVWI